MKNVVKVLILDDDKASSTVLAEVVKRLGFKPVVANKPNDALNVVRLQTVHAAVVDVLLPKISGVDLIEEFRKTKFAENPVIFVSGVFKDRTFANEAIKKTGAVDFLFKPFKNEELSASLQKALGGLLISEKWTVQSLVTRRLNQPRERAKAIEHLEQIKGLDFPYVLAFLMDGQVSGHLNIVSDTGEIFGVTLNRGCITEVDSTESQSTAVLALISNGYFAQEDWDEFQANGNKRFSLERLVQEGYVSPHAINVAKREQIISDFKGICAASSLQLNFVPQDEGDDMPKHAVEIGELMAVFAFAMGEFFSEEFLTSFYEPTAKSPMQFNREPAEASALLAAPIFAPLKGFDKHIAAHGTLEAFIQKSPEHAYLAYQAVHLLVLNGLLLFDDVNKARDLNLSTERYKKLLFELRNRTPDKIFEYFGAGSNATKASLNSIFEEYTRSNNPAQLPKDAGPELVDLCRQCFELVKSAHEVLTDEDKRTQFLADQQAKGAADIKASNKLAGEGLELLRKGQFAPALKKVQEAEALHPTSLQFLIQVWAEVKAGGSRNKARLIELLKRLDSMSSEDRKSPYYFMALGLVKKSMGDPTAAGHFEKALQIDPQFLEARRELSSIAPSRKEKKDLFSGDITQIVSQLFRRK